MPGGNWFAWPEKALAVSQFMQSKVGRFIHTSLAENDETKSDDR
jgi:hypothetical protein